MAAINIDHDVLALSKNKVVIITGGANGIGAATVARFYHSGAHVFFSDSNVKSGAALEQTLQATSMAGDGTCVFSRVDVKDYQAQLTWIDGIYQKYGRIDMAVYSAGISESMGWIVSADITLESLKEIPQPAIDVIDINLNGCLYFTRIALAYLNQGSIRSQLPSKSLTLISSATAFQEGPGLCSYTASKAGILGLMRSLRSLTPRICNTRINVVCPWATDTAMIAAYVHLFRENGIPLNSPDEVAVYTQHVACDIRLNGKNVYVGGGKGFDIEEGLDKTLPQWLGQKNLDGWKLQADVFGKGDWIGSN